MRSQWCVLGVLVLLAVCEQRGAAAEIVPTEPPTTPPPPAVSATAELLHQALAEMGSLRSDVGQLVARADAADAVAAALVERVRLLEQRDRSGNTSGDASDPSSWNSSSALEVTQRDGRRRAQSDEVPPDSGEHSFMHLIKRNATLDWTSGHDSDPDPETNQSPARCDEADLPSRTAAINFECCNELSEDCTGGYPRTCNAGCASLFLPFWRDCGHVLGKSSRQFEPVVQLCERAGTATSQATRFPVQCVDDSTAEECVPECNAACHGWTLLLNVDGNDALLTCVLDHGQFSWSGPVGGFLGHDVRSFLAAVITGAPGWYFITLSDHQAVETALTIEIGQNVVVTGIPELSQATSWDAVRVGGWQAFTVLGDGMLSLTNMAVHGMIRISPKGRVFAATSTFRTSIVLDTGAELFANASTFNGDLTANGGSAMLTGCTLNATTSSLRASGYGQGVHATIALRQMSVPSGVLSSALSQLTSPGATLELSDILVSDWTDAPLSGVATVGESGALETQPPDLLSVMPLFVVNSGPCTVSKDGHCVGRPDGYNRLESCSIAVGGVQTVTLGACSVFDTDVDHYDRVSWRTGSDGKSFEGSNCPNGEQLDPGQEIMWSSDSGRQGSVGQDPGNGCAAKGLCGRPWSLAGIGGGWQICAE